MIGLPHRLNTKQDVLVCVELAQQGKLNKQEVKNKIEGLLVDKKVWVFVNEVEESYIPQPDEKIIIEEDSENTKYLLYRLQDNPDAWFLQLGFTLEEIVNIFNNLNGGE